MESSLLDAKLGGDFKMVVSDGDREGRVGSIFNGLEKQAWIRYEETLQFFIQIGEEKVGIIVVGFS